jgi:hypothetical protein
MSSKRILSTIVPDRFNDPRQSAVVLRKFWIMPGRNSDTAIRSLSAVVPPPRRDHLGLLLQEGLSQLTRALGVQMPPSIESAPRSTMLLYKEAAVQPHARRQVGGQEAADIDLLVATLDRVDTLDALLVLRRIGAEAARTIACVGEGPGC